MRLLQRPEMRQHLVHAVRVVVGRGQREGVHASLGGVSRVAQRQAGRAIADVGNDRDASGDVVDGRLDGARPLLLGEGGELTGGAHDPDAVHATLD